jgi:hypothetical protein
MGTAIPQLISTTAKMAAIDASHASRGALRAISAQANKPKGAAASTTDAPTTAALWHEPGPRTRRGGT